LDSQPWINLGSKLEGQILQLIGWKEQHDHDQDKKGPKLQLTRWRLWLIGWEEQHDHK
jgi:hypothetical protein